MSDKKEPNPIESKRKKVKRDGSSAENESSSHISNVLEQVSKNNGCDTEKSDGLENANQNVDDDKKTRKRGKRVISNVKKDDQEIEDLTNDSETESKTLNKKRRINTEHSYAVDLEPKTKPFHDAIKSNVENLVTAMKTKSPNALGMMQVLLEGHTKGKETGSDKAIISHFIQRSNLGVDLVDFADHISNGKPTDAQKSTLFHLMELVLLYFSQNWEETDDKENPSIFLVKQILHSHVEMIKNSLLNAEKSSHIKPVFKLLIAMVIVSPSDVAGSLNISPALLFKHLRNRDPRDPQDVRTCLIHFILSFLMFGDATVVRQLCEKRELLTCPFPGLKDDEASLIELFLKTVLEKIVRNPVVTKTTKVRIFHVMYLKTVIDLLQWKGPAKYSKKDKYSKNENKGTETLVSTEDEMRRVYSVAQEFLTELLSSHKNGIIFKRLSIRSGLKTENLNHTVTQLLKYLPNPFENEFKSALVSSVLAACPEQIYYFYPYVKHSFEPRNSPFWFEAMQLLIKVAKSFNLKEMIAVTTNGKFDKYLCRNILLNLGLGVFTKTDIEAALKNESLKVRSTILKYLTLAVSEIQYILDSLEKDETLVENSKNLSEALTVSVTNVLPSPVLVFPNILGEKELCDKNELNLRLDWIMNSVKFLSLINEVFPNAIDMDSIPTTALLIVLNSQDDKPQIESVNEIREAILKLLVKRVEKKSDLLNDPKETNIVYMLLVKIVIHDTDDCTFEGILLQLLKFYLGGDQIVEDSLNELKMWITILKNQKSKILPAALEFLWKVILSLLIDPRASFDACVALQTDEKGNIIKDDDNIYDEKLDFSPLVPAALNVLKDTDERWLPTCITFLEEVLVEILHQSFQPHTLCSFVMNYDQYLSNNMKEYLSFWIPESKIFEEIVQNFEVPEATTSTKEDLQLAFKILRCKPELFQDICERFTESDFKLKKSLSVVNQTLFYIQSELNSVSSGGDPIGVSWFLDYLNSILIAITGKVESRPGVISKREIYDKIVGHPALIKWFLTIDNHAIFKNVENTVTLVTRFLTNHLKCYLPFMPDSVSSKYRFKTLLFIERIRSGFKDEFEDFYGCVMKLSEKFPGKMIALALDALSGSEAIRTSSGVKLLCIFLVKYLQQTEETHRSTLKFQTVNSLFKVSQTPNIHGKYKIKFEKLLLKLLEAEPRFCYAIESEWVLEKSTNPERMTSVNLVLFLARHNQAQLKSLCKWLKFNSGLLMVWPHAYILHLAIILYEGFGGDTAKSRKMLRRIGNNFVTTLNTLISSSNKEHKKQWWTNRPNIIPILQILLEENIYPLESLKTSAENISKDRNTAPSPIQFVLSIQVLQCLIKQKQSSQSNTEEILVHVLLSWFDIVLKEKTLADFEMKLFFDEAKTCFEQLPDSSVISSVAKNNSWFDFLQLSFETLRLDSRNFDTLVANLDFIFCVCKKIYALNVLEIVNPTAHEVFLIYSSNTNSLAILREEQNEGQNLDSVIELKSRILDIITFLATNDRSIYNENHFKLFLECYRGTLRIVDQKILCLMKLYETNNTSMSKYSPYLWGKAAADHFVRLLGKSSKIMEPKLEDVTNILRRDFVMKTALHFPLDLQLSPIIANESGRGACSGMPDWQKYSWRMYDPRFLMPLLSNLLEPGMFVNCLRFIYSNCFVLCLAALSSNSEEMRGMAYLILAKFYRHLETSYAYKDRKIYMTFVELLVNSVNQKNKKLPSITTNYYIKVAIILGNSSDPLYKDTYHNLLSNPTLELDCIPNFRRLFNGNHLQHAERRRWIINVIKDGFQTNVDFHLCQKSFIFTAILMFSESTVSSSSDRIEIIELILAVIGNRAAAFCLYRDHNILAWMASLIDKEPDMLTATGLLKIMQKLWQTSLETPKLKNNTEAMEISKSDKHPFNFSFPMDFVVTHLSILSVIRRKLDVETQLAFFETLQLALQYILKSDTNYIILLQNVHIAQIMDIVSNLKSNYLNSDSNITTTDRNDVLKCVQIALNVVILVSPNIIMDKSLFSHVFTEIINYESCDLSDLIKWLLKCFEKNPELVLETFNGNSTNSLWRYSSCNRLVKLVAISNDKAVVENVTPLLKDMIYLAQHLFDNSKLTLENKNLLENINNETFDESKPFKYLPLTLEMWSSQKSAEV